MQQPQSQEFESADEFERYMRENKVYAGIKLTIRSNVPFSIYLTKDAFPNLKNVNLENAKITSQINLNNAILNRCQMSF